MSLTKLQYSVLSKISTLEPQSKTSQRDIATQTGISLGSVNSSLKELESAGFIKGTEITEAGLAELEPYKVDNAIIMAAGLSSRFVPLSYEKPKGLYEVRGEILIERQIRQLQEAGIDDITVVVGYMKELFFYLEDKFGVKIRVNEEFAQRNNNSTLMLVKEELKNTYICSSDDYFTENVFEKYVYEGYYSVCYFEGETDEYCVTEGTGGRITKVQIGGHDAWAMSGHVYFDREFSQKFRDILVKEYDLPATANKLWEDIYVDHLKELKLVARHYEPGIIYEFDSIKDLTDFDHDFITNVDSKIFDNICKTFDCERGAISNIVRIKEGLTNLSFKFDIDGKSYVYRHPGNGTEKIITRASETFSQGIAKKLGIDDTFIFEDENEGWKISEFVPNCVPFDYHTPWHVDRAMQMVKKLHECGEKSKWTFNLYDKAEGIYDLLCEMNYPLPEDFASMREMATQVNEKLLAQGGELCLCHNDFYDPNFLVSGDDIYLIDWEYSAMSDYASDLGTFICCSDYTVDEAKEVIEKYFGRRPTPDEMAHCIGYVELAAWYWYVWAIYKEATGDPTGEWIYLWHKYSKSYGKLALELFSNL